MILNLRFQSVTLLLVTSSLFNYSCTSNQDKPADFSPTLWDDQTEIYLPETAEWTNRVEVADINGDSLPDLLFANGGDYSKPGKAESCRVFINQGPQKQFKEDTALFGELKFYARVVRVADLNNDLIPDIIIGNTYQTQSELFFGKGNGEFERVTDSHLPELNASVGDVEVGDVDGDGFLDIILADWGTGDAMLNEGGKIRLWVNNGTGHFTDVTDRQMPDILVEFSWDIEFFDFDNDFDLDVLVSCKRCGTSKIYVNDGLGSFSYKRLLPAYTNNYDFEIMDINKDGFLDLITINDGEIVGGIGWSRREHIFMNDSGRYFMDATHSRWPDQHNVGEDDNNNVFVDYDSDGDADFITSSLTGLERLSVNDGAGNFSLMQPIMNGPETPHTLSIVVADINQDHKPDIIMGQGEGENDIEERIYIGSGIPADTAAPEITHVQNVYDSLTGSIVIKARIHDRKSPSVKDDWKEVTIINSENKVLTNMCWYGEYLWFAKIPINPRNQVSIRAIDAAGNTVIKKLEELKQWPIQ